MTRTITITSGKGGVGKTNISVNLALHLATLGHRTCLFDADLGLANINILLGLNPEHDLEDVILNRRTLQDIIIRDYKGIDIIPGSSGTEKMANLEDDQVDHLIRSFSELDGYDFLIFDTSAGVSRNVISFCLASSEVLLIITPEPTSMTDAYALLKILSLNGFKGTAKIVVNQCKSIPIAKFVYNKFKETVKKYLPIDVMPLGIVIHDKKVVEAVKTQQALVLLYPESNASKCIKNITKHLLENKPKDLEASGMASFWTRCLQLIKSPLNLTGSKKEEPDTALESSNQDMQQGPPQAAPEESVTQQAPDKEKPDTALGTSDKDMQGGPPQAAPEKSIAPQAPDKEEPTAVTSGPAGHKSTSDMEQGVYLLMSKVIDSIESVSQELQLMRKAIEDGGGNGLGMNKSADNRQSTLHPNAIILDFDAYQKQHGINIDAKNDE
jgi:flagellar biosynthesis protein FlhG